MSKSTQDPLLAALDGVAKRRVLQQTLLRGLVWVGGLLLLWAVLTWVEAQLWLVPSVRLPLVLVCLGIAISVGGWVLLPAWRFSRLSGRERWLGVGRWLGAQLPEVADTLVNYVQLADQQQTLSLRAADLALRRSTATVPGWNRVIRWTWVWRCAGSVGVAIMVWVLLSILSPAEWAAPQARLLAPTVRFDPPPPFELVTISQTNPVVEGQPFRWVVQAKGRALPERLEAFLNDQGTGYALRAKGRGRFVFDLSAPPKDFTIQLGTDRYRGQREQITVLRWPVLRRFSLDLYYPRHTALRTETLAPFMGDAVVPAGTILRWKVQYDGPVAWVALRWGAASVPIRLTKGQGSVQRQALSDTHYFLEARSDAGLWAADSQRFVVRVVADRAPVVQLIEPAAEKRLDETGLTPLVFEASDDYGITAAWLLWRRVGADSLAGRQPLMISPVRGLHFADRVDWISLGITALGTWELAIEVADNDGVNGAKRSRTPWQRLWANDRLEVLQGIDSQADSIAGALGGAAEQSEAIRRELERLRKEALEGKPFDYGEQRRLEQLLEQERGVQQNLGQAQDALEQLAQEMNRQQASEPTQRDALEKLREQLAKVAERSEVEDFLKDLLKNAEQRSNAERFLQLEQLNRTGRYQQADLKRMQRLFEQWRDRQQREALADRVHELSEQQESLQNRTEERRSKDNAEQLAQEQQRLAQQLAQQRQALEQLERRAESPKDSTGRTQAEQQAQGAQQQMQQAQQQLRQRQLKKAAQQQQQATEQLQQLEQNLRTAAAQDENDQAQEDYDNLRALAENLIKLSFDQEQIKRELAAVRSNDPTLKQRMAYQVQLKEEMAQVADSLEALAGRVPQIQQEVLDLTRHTNESIESALSTLDQRDVTQAGVYQQEAMAGLNTLANRLVDALSQLQMQMRAAQRRQGKPRPGSGNLRDLAQQQDEFGQEMREADGEKEAEARARCLKEMAERQSEIRQRLQELYKEMQQKGESGLGNLGKVAEQMQENEADLRAQQLTQQTLERQQQILNRMLEYDKSLREREYDERRASQTGQDRPHRVESNTPQSILKQPRADPFRLRRLTYSPELQEIIDLYFQPKPQIRPSQGP